MSNLIRVYPRSWHKPSHKKCFTKNILSIVVILNNLNYLPWSLSLTKKLTKETDIGKAEVATIGERIKQLRDKETRKSFCDKLGIAVNTLINYENDARVPDAKLIAKICAIYNISTDWLILGTTTRNVNFVGLPIKTTTNMAQAGPSSNEKIPAIALNKKGWALGLGLSEFEDLWDEYRSEQEARRGWLQVEVIKRLPEFIEWLEQRQDPLKPAQIAALKKREQLLHYGLPNQLEDD